MPIHSITSLFPNTVHRPWAWKHWIIPLVLLLGIAFTVWLGFMPDSYKKLVMGLPRQPFHADSVAAIALPITLHAGLMFAILRPASYRESWGWALRGYPKRT